MLWNKTVTVDDITTTFTLDISEMANDDFRVLLTQDNTFMFEYFFETELVARKEYKKIKKIIKKYEFASDNYMNIRDVLVGIVVGNK